MREKIKQKLGTVHLTHEDFNMICKDRMDFGFDSIYFRYAEAIKELSFFKEMEERRRGNTTFDRINWVKIKLEHFWYTLEQLTRAHQVPEEPKIIPTTTLNGVCAEEAAKVFKEFAETAQEATGGF